MPVIKHEGAPFIAFSFGTFKTNIKIFKILSRFIGKNKTHCADRPSWFGNTSIEVKQNPWVVICRILGHNKSDKASVMRHMQRQVVTVVISLKTWVFYGTSTIYKTRPTASGNTQKNKKDCCNKKRMPSIRISESAVIIHGHVSPGERGTSEILSRPGSCKVSTEVHRVAMRPSRTSFVPSIVTVSSALLPPVAFPEKLQ